MTFEEAKALLADMRAAKRRSNVIKARIADLESDYASIQSSLGGDGTHGGVMQSRVEQLALRVAAEREKHMAALEELFTLEDRLSDAIDTLDFDEREVILSCYFDGNPNWKVGEAIGCSPETVKRRKRRAIHKISQILQS